MKGLILAGGIGNRTGLPFNKCLLVYKGKTCLEHCIDRLKSSGIEDIGIVIGKKSCLEVIEIVAKYKNICLFVQPEPKGTANAILCAKRWLTTDFIVVMADNYLSDNFNSYISEFYKSDTDVLITSQLCSKESARHLGVIINNRIVEKPALKNAKKKYYLCYAGIMIISYESRVLFNKIFPLITGEFSIVTFFNLCKNRQVVLVKGICADIGNLYEKLFVCKL